MRFEEFASFAATLCGTWVGVALLMGAYRRDSTSGLTCLELTRVHRSRLHESLPGEDTAVHIRCHTGSGWFLTTRRSQATTGHDRLVCTGGLADIQTAAWRTLVTWGCSMPVAAAQLVLVTAAEDRSLVGAAGFASALPLAASGDSPVLHT